MPTPLRKLLHELTRGGLVDLAWSMGLLVCALLVALFLSQLLLRSLRAWANRTDTPVDDQIVARLNRPLRWLLPVLCLRGALPMTTLPIGPRQALQHTCLVGIVACLGWVAMAVVAIVEDVVNQRFDVNAADNLRARAIQTQVRGFRNIARFAIGTLTLAVGLMTFDGVRQLGVSLLASAGVAGIVLGFAAQRSISTIFAGLQIALTQPIRVDDVVIVEG